MFTDFVYKWLESALDYGITEEQFWDMTIAELIRAIESVKRVKQRNLQEKAHFDYKLADLIGKSVSRIYSASNAMPDISEAYPSLFDSEEVEEIKSKKQDELSAQRFKQFAQLYNANFHKGGGKKD